MLKVEDKRQGHKTEALPRVSSPPVYVTQPSLPPLNEYIPYLEKIWKAKWLTNNGGFHQELESELADFLGVKYVSLFCNGTIALQVGLRALGIMGEVITTPYTFVATTHAIHWNGCTPVFCDIDPSTLNIDPGKIESLISPKTSAILPVHVYGTPCDFNGLQKIADDYGLKIFYDAAHAFGVRLHGRSVLDYGDLSMLSFHATKIFTTCEGGALITRDPKLKRRIDFLKNFGFADEVTVVGSGSNGKMDEMKAALGLLQLKYVEEEIGKCCKIARDYREALCDLPGLSCLPEMPGVASNYCYFPIFIQADEYGLSRDAVYEKLKSEHIYARRYFYPLTSQFPSYRNLPSARPSGLLTAEKVANEVICLPIFPDLDTRIQSRIISILRDVR